MIDSDGFDELGRPCWDLYLMSLAFDIVTRSLDPSTKHGAVVVDNDNGIIVTGYNSPPGNSNDAEIPLERPKKYLVFSHAEEAAINRAAKRGNSLDNMRIYITGYPCHKCVRKMLGAGLREFVYGPVKSFCVDAEDEEGSRLLLNGQKLVGREFTYLGGLQKLKKIEGQYIDAKLPLEFKYPAIDIYEK